MTFTREQSVALERARRAAETAVKRDHAIRQAVASGVSIRTVASYTGVPVSTVARIVRRG